MSQPEAGAASIELRPVASPHAAAQVTWPFDFCRTDLKYLQRWSPAQIDELIEQYCANARLTFAAGEAGFADSLGAWRAVPPAVRRMVQLDLDGMPHGTPGDVWIDSLKRLLFLDGAGRTAVVLPNYGWNRNELRRWSDAAGWDTSSVRIHGDALAVEEAFPGYQDAPQVYPGHGYPAPGSGGRLSRWRRRRG